MIVLIVAGGSGTRLWPLSVPEYPKHLLNIVGKNSLLQNTFERAKKITSVDKIYVSTESSHSDHVIAQLPGLDKNQIIIEPARRGTMPCITNALQIIASKHGEDEPIASIWADQHIRAENAFAETFEYAGEVSLKYGRITLIGIEPESPSIKFGYIEKDGRIPDETFLHSVNSFKEKPDYKTAQTYLASGDYLWNAGYFVAPYKVFKNSIAEHADNHWIHQLERIAASKNQEEANNIYLDYKDEAIDTALIENVPDLMVVPGTFDWADVGSFDDVHRISPKDTDGNTVNGENIHIVDSEEVYVRNHDSKKPVAVIGVDNIIVVNTENGILVMRTDQSQLVKKVVGMLPKKD